MIKLKKIVAVALATTMCMGLSMTAFAVDRGSAVANLNNWNPDSPYYVQMLIQVIKMAKA